MMTQNYENKVLDKSKEKKEETYIRVPDKDLAKEIEDAAKKDDVPVFKQTSDKVTTIDVE